MATDIEARVKALRDEHEEALDDLAETWRREVLLPLCDARRVSFYQGMGTWFFALPGAVPGEGISDEHDAREQGAEYLIPLLKALDTEVGNGPNDHFGFLVEQYEVTR